tara:strand:- start:1373 stop:1660 length:288 start_codon:yes stop_codon:yes gene_type:complete
MKLTTLIQNLGTPKALEALQKFLKTGLKQSPEALRKPRTTAPAEEYPYLWQAYPGGAIPVTQARARRLESMGERVSPRTPDVLWPLPRTRVRRKL